MFSFDSDEYKEIPEGMRQGLLRYAKDNMKAGGFVEALASNDLKEAVGRADPANRPLISVYVLWLMNEAPSDCFGSALKYSEWVR